MLTAATPADSLPALSTNKDVTDAHFATGMEISARNRSLSTSLKTRFDHRLAEAFQYDGFLKPNPTDKPRVRRRAAGRRVCFDKLPETGQLALDTQASRG